MSIAGTINLYVNQLPQHGVGVIRDLTDIGLSTTLTNKSHTIADIWDGKINFDYINKDAAGNFFEPKVGQTVRDIQSGATAVVTYYQRNSNNATVFVKTVTGTWSQGSLYGQNAQIGFLAIPGDPSPTYQVDRNIGQVQYVSLGLPSEGIGKLLVFEAATDYSFSTNSKFIKC